MTANVSSLRNKSANPPKTTQKTILAPVIEGQRTGNLDLNHLPDYGVGNRVYDVLVEPQQDRFRLCESGNIARSSC